MNARDRIREFRRVPAKLLHPHPENWRVHPKAQTSALLGVLSEIGFADAAIAYEPRPDYLELIDGHARVSLAGPEELIPTLILDVTEDEARKLLLSMDTITGMADVDRNRLAQLVDAASFADSRASALLEHIRRNNRLPVVSPRVDHVSAQEAGPRVTEGGDIWELGKHRVLCGDATEPSAYQRLLGGNGAALIFTDPPYGVGYQGDGFAPIANDDRRRDELIAFLQAAFRWTAAAALPGAAWYIWHASATRYEFETAMRRAGLEELQYIVWVKPTLVLGHADYQWQHEPCFYAAAAGGPHPPFYGARTETTAWHLASVRGGYRPMVLPASGIEVSNGKDRIFVAPAPPRSSKPTLVEIEPGEALEITTPQEDADVWTIARDAGKADHPTQKPVALAARAITNSSLPDQIVLDPFLGSGTTLMAAEHLGRRCFGIELDPGYVDGIVARWEAATGRKGVRITADVKA